MSPPYKTIRHSILSIEKTERADLLVRPGKYSLDVELPGGREIQVSVDGNGQVTVMVIDAEAYLLAPLIKLPRKEPASAQKD